MVRHKLNDSFESEPSAGDESETPMSDYLETIALLQEEVERLEQELQAHDARQKESTSNEEDSARDESEAAGTLEEGASGLEVIEQYQAELASRDETIRLLMEELSRVEEAQAATRAEWEHLAGWMAELEHRVEGQDGDALRQLQDRLAAQEQKAAAVQAKSERERRAWEAQRVIEQAEIARLQGLLDQVATAPEAPGAHDGRVPQGPGPGSGAVEALQAENLRLRAAWHELVERTSALTERSEALEAKLAETLNERHQLHRELEHVQDERKREQLEHKATVADLQARLSQAALTHPQGPPHEARPQGISPDREVELHIRALRQHLLEVDEREKEERSRKNLISRLSRIWSRTGPR